MRRRVSAWCFGLLVWLAALAVSTSAHHSMAMYDTRSNITVTGSVARIELKNPHSLFYIAATDKDGKQVDWMLECQPLATLATYGWSASTMKVGDKVTAAGSPARNGKPAMLVRAIQLPDGRTHSYLTEPCRRRCEKTLEQSRP